MRDRFLKRFFIVAIALIIFARLEIDQLSKLSPHGLHIQQRGPQLTDARAQHILHGDNRGGGHLHGAGRPCKSEFPEDWDADKIIQVVKQEAANDNHDWKRGKNGNDVADVEREGLKIRIVVNGQHSQIITAYPINVPRNPCPAPANDND